MPAVKRKRKIHPGIKEIERRKDREKIKVLASENAGLRERIEDLSAQLTKARASRLLSPSEEEAIARLRAEHHEMNQQQNQIALFLRHNFAEEIVRGEHAGMSLVDVITKYLSRVKHEIHS
jgi:hypothetical protein